MAGRGVPFLPKYPFPAVTFAKTNDGAVVACFNKHAQVLFAGVEYVDVLNSSDHIIFATKNKVGLGDSKIGRTKHGDLRIRSRYFINFPLEGRTFKVYRCTHGFAIRKYEPIGKEVSDGKFV